jgi:hypothetical protein
MLKRHDSQKRAFDGPTDRGSVPQPEKDAIAFVDHASIPFEKTEEGICRVRMQRIGSGY